ncbi:MAG: hypothetical protein GKR89_03635 [Candidatus Latescibacteria bacterium]|nr:hypothetical protein [Candidatus Latescibacterota bacterium]
MNDEQKYLFDLTGYLVLRQVLTPDEVAVMNQGIDRHIDQLEPLAQSTSAHSQTLQGTQRRHDLGGMLAWERPWCEPFRRLLAHPVVKPCLETVLGAGYRLDHGPGLIAMNRGAEGCTMHGGGVERTDLSEVYIFNNGRIMTGLTVVEFLLADEGPGDGGVAVIPGSHKANIACPESIRMWEKYREQVVEVNGKAGDAIMFTETLTHGTLPWTAAHQRRALLYKFSPGVTSYGSGAHEVAYPDYIGDMSEEERAVMEAPHVRR